MQALPLHFGGRYLFQGLPAIPGLLPAPITGIQALALGLPAAYIQGYGNSSATYGYSDLSLFAQDEWRSQNRHDREARRPVPEPVLAGQPVQARLECLPRTRFLTTTTISLRVSRSRGVRPATRRRVLHGAYGVYYDNLVTGAAGIAYIVNGTDGVRTLVSRFPATIAAWNAPGHRLPEAAGGTVPSLVISIDPGLTTSYAHQMSTGFDHELPGQVRLTVNYVYARGLNQLGTIDYNPVVRALGAGRRPLDVDGRAGTSASVLQYTSFGGTWYNGVTVSAAKPLGSKYQFLASYTVSKADDNSTDFPSAFLPENNGLGRDPANPNGLPIGFDPDSERGPSLQDQRHHLVLSWQCISRRTT